ncbi:RNA-directed DNA polymerase, eukaryota, reverse transcriptase zinc-binding domain protein [Tanacetum coccineum]
MLNDEQLMSSKSVGSDQVLKGTNSGLNSASLVLNNSFDALEDGSTTDDNLNVAKTNSEGLGYDNDSEEVKNIIMEQPRFMGGCTKPNETKGQALPLKMFLMYSMASWNIRGSRILLGWNSNDVDLLIISQDAQVMHTRIWFKADKKELPWCLLGDFNAALYLEDHYAGSLNIDISMTEFKDCVDELEVSDVNHSGLNFTWNQKPKVFDGILKKIDRVMANLEIRLKRAGTRLILREEEAAYVLAFNDALIMEEIFLKQKAKVEWLRVGDSNLAYFHKDVKGRISRSRIDVVSNSEGVLFAADQVLVAFVNHYADFLGQQGVTLNLNTHNLFTNKLNSNVALDMIKTMTPQEVKYAIFSMGNDGPDGYTALFFKEAWDIMANDVTNVVQEFFNNGTLLKELNHIVIALIPKVASPTRINDYRPISCCNVLSKCISKIISNRIKESLTYLISPNQYAFVPERRISDNILLTQELMHNYHLDRGPPRCAFKIDIQKAYDTVDWGFLSETLMGFGFHPRMIHWIIVTTRVSGQYLPRAMIIILLYSWI